MKDITDIKKIIDISLEKIDISKEMKLKLIKAAKTSKKAKYIKLSFASAPIIAVVLAFLIIFTNLFPISWRLTLQGNNLMFGITSHKVKAAESDDVFINSTADFSIDLFKHSYTQGKNSFISPLSVYLALGMTANGADGNTLKEFEAQLGRQNLNITGLNSYYKNLYNRLTNTQQGKLNIANSIWYRNDKSLNVKKSFLQTNADYYNASAYKADFTNPNTVSDINSWVNDNTGKEINKIIDKINPNTIMYLINALYFKDTWKTPFDSDNDIHDQTFELIDGTKKDTDFMTSTEECFYDADAKGFIKPYKNSKYSFVAILPNEKINIYDYVSSLSGKNFISLIKNKMPQDFNIALPRFSTEYSVDLVEPLKQMGLKDCFNEKAADFSKMANSSGENIFIGDILHKAFINVDHQGTEAAAVTKVEIMRLGGGSPFYTVYLNRPFIYAIVDNETYLPIFMGIMMDPTDK